MSTKTRRLIEQAFSEVKEESFKGGERQRIAVALSKAKQKGAKVPPSNKKKKHVSVMTQAIKNLST